MKVIQCLGKEVKLLDILYAISSRTLHVRPAYQHTWLTPRVVAGGPREYVPKADDEDTEEWEDSMKDTEVVDLTPKLKSLIS